MNGSGAASARAQTLSPVNGNRSDIIQVLVLPLAIPRKTFDCAKRRPRDGNSSTIGHLLTSSPTALDLGSHEVICWIGRQLPKARSDSAIENREDMESNGPPMTVSLQPPHSWIGYVLRS